MRVEELLEGCRHRWARGTGGFDAAGVTHDSRRVGPGFLFVALRGAVRDGVDHVPEAVSRGAAGVVVDRGRGGEPALASVARVIEVDEARRALAVLARNLHRRVDETLAVIGITGTNGKTTTAHAAARVLEAGGVKTGVLGTIGHWLGDAEVPADRTTPEAPELHGYMDRMRAAGCGACVMEVSSHAIDMKRVHGIGFAAAVFTNLSRDHLDHHGTMDSYFETKSRLFDQLASRAGVSRPAAIVNHDDQRGRTLAGKLAGARGEAIDLIGFGTGEGALLRIAAVDGTHGGSRIRLETPSGPELLESPLYGLPNAYNLTAAAAVGLAMGVSWKAIRDGLASMAVVPGRLEPVEVPGRDPGFAVIVDYAHTDDALRVTLGTVRVRTDGRVIVVFGCGGDRDRSKRSEMGKRAAEGADLLFVTSDNPRTEDPDAIIAEILAGVRAIGGAADRTSVEPDRRKAIERAIGAARAGDTVVIAGKGHETYQIKGVTITPFDDRKVARAALERALGVGDAGNEGV